jgi:hypothetical protein
VSAGQALSRRNALLLFDIEHEGFVMTMRSANWSVLCGMFWLACGCGSDAKPAPAKPAADSSPTSSSTSPDSTANGAAGAGAPNTDGNGPLASPYPDIRGGCGIDSGYADDEACLPAPDPSEGMQIHVGPSNYQDKDEIAKYILMPGEEVSACWTFHTPNEQEIYYQSYTLSGRAGTHHIINTMYNMEMTDGGFVTCADPGTGTNSNIIDNLPGASKPYMERTPVAPENEHIGRKVPAHVASQADMHYYNFTDKPLLREFWMNIYFADKDKITMIEDQIRGMGGLSWNSMPIPPRTDMVYKYSCPITGDGRVLSLLGHYHSHGQRFTASLQRKSGDVEKVFEMYDYLDPATFQYDTVSQNPDFSDSAAGAVSGMLNVSDGDTLLWECHIVNDSDVGLTYTNMVKTGEMCNMWGSSLGITPLNCLIP